MGSVVISGATSGAVTLAVPDEAGTRTLTLPATTGTILTNDISQAGDTSAGNAAAVGYTSAEGLILTGQGSTSDVTIKNDADATVLSIPTGTTNVGIGTTTAENPLTIQDIGGSTFNRDFAIRNGDASNYHRLVLGYNAASAASGVPTNAQFVLAEKGGGYGTSAGLVVGNSDNAPVMFTTNATERMRIDSSGNVGIGTSSPSQPLDVVASSSTAVGAGLRGRSADNLNITAFFSNDGATRYSQIRSASDRLNVSTITAIPLVFDTSNAERMRIAAGGQVLINSTSTIASDTAPLQVTGGSVTAVALKGGTNNYFMAFYNTSNSLIGSITGSTGSITYYNTTSDYRLKENVNYTWDATSQLKQLKPAKFNFIADPDNTVDGFIAHEVQEVVPHAVTGEKDGKEMQVIDHSKLVPLLTASLQEALKRIDSLEEQVNALKGK